MAWPTAFYLRWQHAIEVLTGFSFWQRYEAESHDLVDRRVADGLDNTGARS
jgi:hypothetical protein